MDITMLRNIITNHFKKLNFYISNKFHDKIMRFFCLLEKMKNNEIKSLDIYNIENYISPT